MWAYGTKPEIREGYFLYQNGVKQFSSPGAQDHRGWQVGGIG